ncbi:hypothetical protein [Rhodovarius sp.]|uniref:hypothetical protein n=1 Tax=Rhodovarius sp. TaxID=2972673 RepID=UPI0034A389A8
MNALQGEMMTQTTPISALAGAALALTACATPPPAGPAVLALPPKGGDYVLFQQQDAACRQNAAAGIGNGSPQVAANQAAAGTVALGTLAGAGIGAAIGSATANAGAGAAIGAGVGALASGGAAANAGAASGYGTQQQYDITYSQCMTAAGNEVQPLAAAPPAAVGYAVPYAYPTPYPYYGGRVYLGVGPRWGGYYGGYRGGYSGSYRGGYYRRR